MKIARLDAIPLEIPFSAGPLQARSGGQPWTTLQILLVRAETSDGLVGWGEAFSYSCLDAVGAAVESMVAPLIVGREVDGIPAVMRELQQTLHIFGRYGITMFALSGLDIALWDLAAKAAGLPLCRILGGSPPPLEIAGYSSLYRYGDREMVAAKCQESLDLGYGAIKLHEITEPEVKAARERIGDRGALMLDANCPWTPAEAHEMATRLKPYNLLWLEEPIFPPEDFDSLATLQRQIGIPLAAGENACTEFQFRHMLSTGAVSYAQPSVTKVGGITEFLKVAALVRQSGVKLMPHSPYFGPGWLATLHLMAALPDSGMVERLMVDVEASLYGTLIDPVAGRFQVPDQPGLGPEPDLSVMASYRARA